MSLNLTSQEIIESALQLPLDERERIFEARRESLIDDSIDHGSEDSPEEVQAAWSEEIAKRIADIDEGRVKTIPWEEAEKLIWGENKPGK